MKENIIEFNLDTAESEGWLDPATLIRVSPSLLPRPEF